MLTEQQIIQANELLTSAVNYNLAMQSAFVSLDDMVTCTLNVNGRLQTVSIPTWHHILQTVNELTNAVRQLQITDDGNDVVQLLSQANKLQFVYLKRQQYYVQSPKQAEIVKFDYESVPTCYSASDRTAMYVDLSKCDLPMDAMYAIVQLDDNAAMRLPILYKTTCFDSVCTILAIDDDAVLVDNNELVDGMTVQVRNSLYEVANSVENRMQLKPLGISSHSIEPGDAVYQVVDATSAFLEVPVTAMHERMTLQIQYMKLLSAKSVYDIKATMDAGIHASLQTALSSVLSGKSTADTMHVINTATIPLPADMQSIVAASRPVISNINITQTNAHQYINSSVEELAKANAALLLARSDIDRYEQLLSQASLTSDMILQYKEQLASAQARYNAAQADIAKIEVSSQDVSPEYEATVYSASVDSNDKPIIQYIARYQRLSYEVRELTTDWQYAYGAKRTIDDKGDTSSDIDDYSVMNFVKLPIRAYEQLAIQIAAVLCYGQPSMTIMTDWSDVTYTQIPADILKEQSVEEMFKNAYEARIYYNLQQAMQAAGVYAHIDITKQFMHKASDIQFSGDVTVLDKLTDISRSIAALNDVANSAQSIAVEVVCAGKVYSVSNGGTVNVELEQSYCTEVFGAISADPAAVHDALGTIVEHTLQLRIINNGAQPVQYDTLIAGLTTEALPAGVANFNNVGVHSTEGDFIQTYGQAAYACKANIAGNRTLVYDRVLPGSPLNDAAFGADVASPAVNECEGDIVSAGTLSQSRGLGIRSGRYSMIDFANYANHEGFAVHEGFAFDAYTVDGVTAYGNIDSATDAMSVALKQALLAQSAKFGRHMLSTAFTQLGMYTLDNVAIGALSASNVVCQPWFVDNDKYTSGDCTRGAALYFAPTAIADLKLAATGTTNATTIEPGNAKALQLPIVFQNRMTDRLGLVDGVDVLTLADGQVVNGDPDTDLTYKKSMSIHLNIGNSDFKFDIVVSQRYR